MIIRDQNEYGLSLAKHLPEGDMWISKSISENNFAKLLYGLALIFIDADIKTNELFFEFYPATTSEFIEEWEELLGIPDGCLDTNGSIEERRTQIVGALGALGAVTKEDWINLADIMGFEIEIDHMTDVTAWPWTWPHAWGATAEENRFIMVVTIKGVSDKNIGTWPWTWPHVWGDDITRFLRCIFNRIKPANILIIYRYQ